MYICTHRHKMASKNSFEHHSGHIPQEVKVDACLTSCYRGGRRLPGCGWLLVTASLAATGALKAYAAGAKSNQARRL